MVIEIRADMDYETFEAVCKNKKFADYPKAAFGRAHKPYVPLTSKNWFKQLEDIASWVNNELNDECIFTLD